MSYTTISSNMFLPVPDVSLEPGPQYAADINNCLGLVDSHDHSFGKGVLITPNGLNINIDLNIQGNNLTNIRAVRFTPQSTTIPATSPDIDELYVSGADLYYNDGNNNIVRITQSGGVAGTPGSISGLASPASASYSSATSTFTFQSNANTPANINAGNIIIGNVVANSPTVTLAPSNAIASSYDITFPAVLPASQSYVTIDQSGNIGTPLPLIRPTGTTVPVGGIGVSASCGAFSPPNSATTLIPNFSVTITTIGNPVLIQVIADGGVIPATFYVSQQTNINFYNNASSLATETAGANTPAVNYPVSSIQHIDTSVAGVPGTYTYTMSLGTNAGSLATLFYAKMIVYEMN